MAQAGAHIESDPAVRGGKPRIAGTRIAVADVAIMHLRLGRPLAEIAATYDLDPDAVEAAMAYYREHRDAIERGIEDDRAFAEAFAQDHPSPMRDKLAALGRG